ncbi:MAG: hypothetical protein ACE5DZ_04925 [Mariprofundus sp.]
MRDVLDPEQSFNPESPVSIVRAVKRFLEVEEQPLSLKSAGDFVQFLLKQETWFLYGDADHFLYVNVVIRS